jgi:hypothetical protein
MLLLLPIFPEQIAAYLKQLSEMTALADGWDLLLLQAIGIQSTRHHRIIQIPAKSATVLASAGEEWAAELVAKTAELSTLEERWENTQNQTDADEVALEPLDYALTAMFALEGIYRVLDQHPDDPRVQAAATKLAEAYDAYDEALLGHIGILCTLADGDALERLRKSLPEACTTVPWWLDGALEDAAKKLVEEMDSIVEAYARRFGDS